MRTRRAALIAALGTALLAGTLTAVGTAPQAAAATVSTTTINCGTDTPGNVTVNTALAAGDDLTVNYTNCNQYFLEWSAFSSTYGTSPKRENGNNTEARALTNYTGAVTAGTELARLYDGSRIFYIVQPAPTSWTAKTPVAGVVGSAYNTSGYQFTASGGGTYSLASGTLPTGLSLSTSGMLSGTPTRIGTFTFAVAATGAGATSGNVSVTITGPVIDKVTICHRTRATTNPYVMITVSVNSVIGSGGGNGHSDHNTTRTNSVNPTTNNVTPGSGPFDTSWSYASNRKWWGDIIPPFTYATGTYSGLNWGPDWNSPNPSSGTSGWLEPSEFAAAVSATNDVYRNAVLQCMNLTGGSAGTQSTKSSEIDTPDKYFTVGIENGEDPDEIRDDLVEQEAIDNPGSGNTPRTIPSTASMETNYAVNAKVRTDPATNQTTTTAVLNGELKSGSTWTSWTYEWGTSTADVRGGTGSSHTYGGGDPSSSVGTGPTYPSYTVTGLTCGTTYYFRIVGTNNATPAATIYGEFKSFTTSSCGGGNSNNGNNNGNNGNSNGNSSTPSPSPSASSTSKPLGKDRQPTTPVPTRAPSASPTPSAKPSASTTPTSLPLKKVNPASTTPAPPGDPWVPSKSRLIDPTTGDPTTKVIDKQGTWVIEPKSGAVSFTPAPGFTGTATLKVRLNSRSGELVIEPISVQVAARSRTLVLSGDVPSSISAGKSVFRRNR